MSGKRGRARKPRGRRAGRAPRAAKQQGPEAEPPPPATGGPWHPAGAASAGHVTSTRPAPQRQPKAAGPEQATGAGSALAPHRPERQRMEGCAARGPAPALGPELLRLHEVQLCLAQEQLLLEDRRRQVQLQMQLWQEEQLWLQQLQEEQAWVHSEGLQLAVALEQLRSEGLEVLQTQGQAPGPNMARRSQSSSQGDNPLAPGYLPPHYKEYYRLAVDALTEGGPEAYSRFLASEGAPDFLSPEEVEHVSRHLQPPQHAAREPPEGSPPEADMDGSSGTYWPVNSDQAVPELDLGWPLTFGFQGTEVTTLVQPPPPDSPSIKDEARRMIRAAQQVVAVVMDMFTDVDLLGEVLEAAARRVPVYILLDEMNAQHFLHMAEKCRVNLHHVDFLRVRTVAGPTYYCRTGKSFKGHVKEKFLLVDCAVVMSGSYSFMWSFEKIHRSLAHVFQGELVSSFDEEFRILFAQSEPLVPAAGARADAWALAPFPGVAAPAPAAFAAPAPFGAPFAAPAAFPFAPRAHLLLPPRDDGLGFPPLLDPDRHFLSALRRDEAALRAGAGVLQARRWELDAVQRHSHDGLESLAARHVSRQTFLGQADDLRFQTSHFRRDQLFQQHFQWGPQRPQGLLDTLRDGQPRLDWEAAGACREPRPGSDPALEPGPGPGPRGPALAPRFAGQAPEGPEGRAGLRRWRLASYLSGGHGEDADEALPAPMEAEASGDGEGAEEAGAGPQGSLRSRPHPLVARGSRLRSSLIFAQAEAGPRPPEQAPAEPPGPGAEPPRSAASAKVAELLEKYRGPARGAGAVAGGAGGGGSGPGAVAGGAGGGSGPGAGAAWREEAPGARRSLESCLLDLRDSFAQRLHQEAERQPGAASLTAAQLLETLGRGGADRLLSGYPSAQGRASPPPDRPGAPPTPPPEPRPSPPAAPPERWPSPTPGFPSPTAGLIERKGSPTPASPERRRSPVPPVPERRPSPGPPVPERRASLTLALGAEPARAEEGGGPADVLRRGSLRLRQLLSARGERDAEAGQAAPQENGQPESPRRPAPGRGDSAEAAAGEERGPRARLASATANALYSSNLRDDTKAILEQISAHGQKHRAGPASPARSSPELGPGLAADMSDKDKCSAIFRSDSLGAQARLSRTLPASAEERERLLRRMESMRKEKRVYSRFEVFCRKEDAGGGAAEEDTRDSKVGKFMPKLLGTLKGKK